MYDKTVTRTAKRSARSLPLARHPDHRGARARQEQGHARRVFFCKAFLFFTESACARLLAHESSKFPKYFVIFFARSGRSVGGTEIR